MAFIATRIEGVYVDAFAHFAGDCERVCLAGIFRHRVPTGSMCLLRRASQYASTPKSLIIARASSSICSILARRRRSQGTIADLFLLPGLKSAA